MSYLDAPDSEYRDSKIMAFWEERYVVLGIPTRLARQMTPGEYLRYRMLNGDEYAEVNDETTS